MTPLLATLHRLSRAELVDLLHVLEDHDAVGAEDDASELRLRLVRQLARLCGLPPENEAALERHVITRLSTALGLDVDAEASTPRLAKKLANAITAAVERDLRPFILVAVAMGWADGALTAEEIAVMDAALSRLKLLARRRNDLLAICSSPIRADQLAKRIGHLAGDEQKAWSMLAFGWAVALADRRTDPREVEAFTTIAAALGVSKQKADTLRDLVTRRFEDSLERREENDEGARMRALSQATLAAIDAAELDQYLRASTGLKSLSVILSTPVDVRLHHDSASAVGEMLDTTGWFGAPALLAGALFLRQLGGDELGQQLLVVALTCLERAGGR